MLKKSVMIAALSFSSLAMADFVEVEPLNYQASHVGDSGAYAYKDWAGEQLTDGVKANAIWSTDLGNGNAYEWVGWYGKTIVIDFLFENSRTFSEVAISSQQAGGGLALPSWSVQGWQDHGWVTFGSQTNTIIGQIGEFHQRTLSIGDLGMTTSKIRLVLTPNMQQPWIFLDEVYFF